MSEPDLQHVLQSYAAADAAPDQFAQIRQEVGRRKVRRHWIRGSALALLLSFCFLSFAPVGGSALAVVRKEIQPTMFLKTNLGEARRIIREPLQLPATYPHHTGEYLPFTDDTKALVARWLTYEMVAVAVTTEEDAMGIISIDLRRSTYKPEPNEEWWNFTPGATLVDVKVGDADGKVQLEADGSAWFIIWKNDQYLYRLHVGQPMTVEQLTAYAAQIR